MPHLIVKLYPGRSERQKAQLAEAIVKDVVAIAKVGDDAVSVAFKKSNRVIGPTRSISRTF
jgi:4-oxalocrotonate tautomerase